MKQRFLPSKSIKKTYLRQNLNNDNKKAGGQQVSGIRRISASGASLHC
jgi:hypothetical protein